MDEENPYESPQADSDASAARPSLMLWSIGAIFLSSTLGGTFGVAIGAALGWLVPNYYRSVFPSGDAESFDPVAVGVGQGLTQGVVFGGVIGLVLVAMYYFYLMKLRK